MSSLICVDPGKRIGYALCVDGRIARADTVGDRAKLPRADIAIIEMPRVYPNASKWKGDPQVIVRLAALAGEIAAQYPAHAYVEPRTWRGMIPEDVLLLRIKRALRPYDCALGRSVHARDAQGIALWLRGTLHEDQCIASALIGSSEDRGLSRGEVHANARSLIYPSKC